MSTTLKPHAPSSKGAILYNRRKKIIFGAGDTVPSDGAAGYSKGCIFIQTDGAAGTHWYVNEGTTASADFNAALPTAGAMALLTASITELNYLDSDGGSSQLTTGAGVGITTGTGTVYKTSIIKIGAIIYTTIYIDLTGLASIATDGDIIGVNGGGAAHIGRITAAQNGTIESMKVFCTETPAGGLADIDVFRATVGTGVQDDAISGITGQATTGAVNITAINTFKCATAVPAANDYLYLCAGAGSGAGTYTAGKLEIHLIGY